MQRTAIDLILWRHAQAEMPQEGLSDLDRALADKGQKQARKIATWLNPHLHENALILASPARRTIQTVEALQRKYRIEKMLSPGASVASVVKTITPYFSETNQSQQLVLVGHQPWLGQLAMHLLSTAQDSSYQQGFCIGKGAVWWLRKDIDTSTDFRLFAVMPPIAFVAC